MKNSYISLLMILILCSCPEKKTSSNNNSRSLNTQAKKYFIIPWNKFHIKQMGYKELELNNLYENTIEKNKNSKANLKDPFLKKNRKLSSSIELYYYKVVDTINYYSVIYFTYGDYEQCYQLVNYSKKGILIDNEIISCVGGDGGGFSNSKGYVINDSTIIREDNEGYYSWADVSQEYKKYYDYDTSDSIILNSYFKIKISVKKNGIIQRDTLVTKKRKIL